MGDERSKPVRTEAADEPNVTAQGLIRLRIGLAAVTQEVFTLARAIPVARLALAARLLDDTGQGRRTPGQGVCPSGLRLMIAAWS